MPLATLPRAPLPRSCSDNPFYAAKLSRPGTGPGSRRLPFTLKQELIEDQIAHPPYGTNLTYPLDRYTRFCQTSATTTGTPMRWLDTPESWDWMVGNWIRVYQAAGIGAGPYLLRFLLRAVPRFLGGLRSCRAHRLHGDPRRRHAHAARLGTIVETCATALCCTPTYAIRLARSPAKKASMWARSAVDLFLGRRTGRQRPRHPRHISKLWKGAASWIIMA